MSQTDRPRIVAGYGRSGTTWVLDVLAQANSLRAVFEPLHPGAVPEAAAHAHKYMASDGRDDDLNALLGRFFYEDFHSIWADYRIRTGWLHPRLSNLKSWNQTKAAIKRFNRAQKYFFRYRAQRHRENRIVKLIRANMILSWLKTNFDARIVFVIRHPAAVVLSQSVSPRSWDAEKQMALYRANPLLLDSVSSSVRKLLSQPLDEIEALTLAWCIENSIAIKQAAECDVPVIYYEELLENGISEWQRILSALDLESMPDSELIARPSQQAWGEQARDPALVRRYESWMTRIDPRIAQRIQVVLDEVGTDVYSVNQALPIARI